MKLKSEKEKREKRFKYARLVSTKYKPKIDHEKQTDLKIKTFSRVNSNRGLRNKALNEISKITLIELLSENSVPLAV